jgi:CRISPR-associated protein Cst2
MKHIFSTIITREAIANNNRGETKGNITTLQKVIGADGDEYSTVSGEAIKFATRLRWQEMGLPVNRVWNEEKAVYEYVDEKRGKGYSPAMYIDDDVMGFMNAKPAKEDAESDTEAEKTVEEKKPAKQKGTCHKRRGRLEVSRAVSVHPFKYDEVMNSVATSDKGDTSMYAAEVHKTAYMYTIQMTPFKVDGNVATTLAAVLEAIFTIGNVGGNHGRFLYDFSPVKILVRMTDDPSARIMGTVTIDPSMKFYEDDFLLEAGEGTSMPINKDLVTRLVEIFLNIERTIQ